MQNYFLKNIKPPKLQIREASSIPSAFTRKNFFHIQEAGYFKKPEITFKQAERAEFLPVFVVLRQWRGHLPRTVIRRRNDLINGACG